MKTAIKYSAKTTTKAPAKSDKVEPHYSLLGVENAESIKGRALRMSPDEATRILDHIKTKYPRLTIHPKHVVVVRLPDERKNGIVVRCQDGTPRFVRTSDAFQQPFPLLSTKEREDAKAKAKADAAKNRKAPAMDSRTKDAAKRPSMLDRAMAEVKDRAAKGKSSVTVQVRKAAAKTPAAKPTTKVAPKTPAVPVVAPAPATVAATPSPVLQS